MAHWRCVQLLRSDLVMLDHMHMMWDALWRAATDCLRGKVIAWTLFPLLLLAGMAALLGLLWWEGAVHAVQLWLQRATWLQWLWAGMGAASPTASALAAAVLVVLLVSPVLIVLTLALVALVMTPHMVSWVAQRRFVHLERKHGGNWWRSALWALGSTAVALLALLLTMPLWLVPPLILVLPPLIGGWLTYRVMAFDALAEHASPAERQAVFAQHRQRLLLMGVVCGLLGTAPSVVWASGLVFAAAFWLLIPLALWIYALVLAFSSLWFAHYGLSALYVLRAASHPPASTHAPSSATPPRR